MMTVITTAVVSHRSPVYSSKRPVKRSATWPDDITCGERIASKQTMPPAIIGRTAGFTLNRVNSCSQAATPRIRVMPNIADSAPMAEAMPLASCV